MIAQTPQPPYYAVIFTTERTDVDEGYSEMAEKMEELVMHQDGFLGMESARSGIGITISYWRDLESIRQWKNNVDHLLAQKYGREKWYRQFKTRVALVERDSGLER